MVGLDHAHAIVEIGWVLFIGKNGKKTKKTFKLDFTGEVEQEMVSKYTVNNLEKKVRFL